jgi:HPt (histidine-containing phosphotransfer) domain-containing protein
MDDGELRQYFAGRLPARVAEVERARDEARDAGWTGPPLRTLHRLAHSLAGARPALAASRAGRSWYQANRAAATSIGRR